MCITHSGLFRANFFFRRKSTEIEVRFSKIKINNIYDNMRSLTSDYYIIFVVPSMVPIVRPLFFVLDLLSNFSDEAIISFRLSKKYSSMWRQFTLCLFGHKMTHNVLSCHSLVI